MTDPFPHLTKRGLKPLDIIDDRGKRATHGIQAQAERPPGVRDNFTDEEVDAAFEELKRHFEALKEIAKQKTSDELSAEEHKWADYVHAYDAAVMRARAALKDKP